MGKTGRLKEGATSMRMTHEERKLYNEAMQKVDLLVDEVFERCDEVADENNFERSWVLERFRDKFNKRKREE